MIRAVIGISLIVGLVLFSACARGSPDVLESPAEVMLPAATLTPTLPNPAPPASSETPPSSTPTPPTPITRLSPGSTPDWSTVWSQLDESRSYRFAFQQTAQVIPVRPGQPTRIEMSMQGQTVGGDSEYRLIMKAGSAGVDTRIIQHHGTIYSDMGGDWVGAPSDGQSVGVAALASSLGRDYPVEGLTPKGTAVVRGISCDLYAYTMTQEIVPELLRGLDLGEAALEDVTMKEVDGDLCVGPENGYPYRLTMAVNVVVKNQQIGTTLVLEFWDFDDPSISVQPPVEDPEEDPEEDEEDLGEEDAIL